MELQDYTITLPAGTTNHSDPHILCPPASWESVAVFFIGNYLSHAATVKLPPATGVMENIWICFTALLMPAAGLYYGLSAFSQAIRGRRNCEVNKAAIAGALCMYVRSDNWEPPQGDWNFEANVQTLAAFANRTPTSGVSSPFQVFWSISMFQTLHPSETARKIRELFKDIRADRFRRPVFRRMEEVDRQRQLEAEGREQEAEGAIEMTERPNTEQRQVALLTVSRRAPGSEGLMRLNPKTQVHGLKYSNPSYELVYVPRNAIVDGVIPTTNTNEENAASHWDAEGIQLSKSKSITKGLVAVLQLCFSIFVLVRSKANQIQIYGYAAFSLTVAPYAVMAAVNLLANAVMPTYSSLYLVRNDVMDEIEKANNISFNNVVGTVQQVDETAQVDDTMPQVNETSQQVKGTPPFNQTPLRSEVQGQGQDQHFLLHGIPDTPLDTTPRLMTPDQAVMRGMLPQKVITVSPCRRLETRKTNVGLSFGILVLGFLLMAAPIVIVGSLSKFQKGNSSTVVQRAVLMTWLTSGQIFGLFMALAMQSRSDVSEGFAKDPLLTSAAEHKDLVTDELLQRLDINADPEWRNKFQPSNFVFELLKTSTLWPLLILARASPEISALYIYVVNALVYGVTAIWGFVIVGQMLLDYGNCIRVY